MRSFFHLFEATATKKVKLESEIKICSDQCYKNISVIEERV